MTPNDANVSGSRLGDKHPSDYYFDQVADDESGLRLRVRDESFEVVGEYSSRRMESACEQTAEYRPNLVTRRPHT
jgi:hypothetical protein